MMVASYFLGRVHYPVPYEVGKLILLLVCAAILYWVSLWLNVADSANGMLLNVLFLLGYLAFSVALIRPNFK